MGDIAISVEGLGKRYRIAHQRDPYGRLSETLAGAFRAPFDRLRGRPRETREWFWALQDVSFDVRQGDVLGVIGRNGAGKSTLLKILSRITEPSLGSARLQGRVGSLLEVGTGFHPELTGRENIFLSGAVLGMRRAELERQFDEIAAFSGVERFLDTPVKRYSSGMQVRLGFSVAAHLRSDILVVDEVLAVGDAEFQRKCLAKMEDASQQGRTVLFVSHNMTAIQALCSSGLLLDGGRVASSGPVTEVIGAYLAESERLVSNDVAERRDRQGNGEMRIIAIEADLRTGSASTLKLSYRGRGELRNVVISVGIFTVRGEGALFVSNQTSGDTLSGLPSEGTLVCEFDKAGLLPGRYTLNAHCTVNGVVADWVIDAAAVEVSEGDYYGTGRLPPIGYGSLAVPYRWSLKE